MEFNQQDSEKERHFLPLFDSRDENKNSKTLPYKFLKIKKKFLNFIAHLQDIPNHILEHHLSTT